MYYVKKKNFSIEDYIDQHKKRRNTPKAAGKVMTTKQNINALTSGIKYLQLKNRVSAARTKPQYLDGYHTTVKFIKEEVWRAHKVDDKERASSSATYVVVFSEAAEAAEAIVSEAEAEDVGTMEKAMEGTVSCPKTTCMKNVRILWRRRI